MCQSKVSIERAMEMSLDEYIMECGILAPPKKFNNDVDIDSSSETGNLRYGNIHCDTTTGPSCNIDDKFNNMSISTPVSSSSSLPSNLSTLSKVKMSPLQQRLINSKLGKSSIQDNNIPPALSMNDLLNIISNNNRNNRKNNRWRQGRGRQNGNGNNGNNRNRGQNNARMNNNGNFNRTQNGKVQKNFNYRNNYVSLPPQLNPIYKSGTTIECTIPDINCASNNSQILNDQNSITTTAVTSPPNEFKTELMPFIAEKLLSLLTHSNENNNKPKYDLQLQKEIHTIQGKSMFFKCPGGEVISSDGPGINCKLVPASTGVSLNQRFA